MATVESLGYRVTFTPAEYELVKQAIDQLLSAAQPGSEQETYTALTAQLKGVQ